MKIIFPFNPQLFNPLFAKKIGQGASLKVRQKTSTKPIGFYI